MADFILYLDLIIYWILCVLAFLFDFYELENCFAVMVKNLNVLVQVQEVYELSAEYEGKHDPKKLEELGNLITSLDAGDSILVAKSFSHMLNLANLAEEVQISRRRRNKLKKGDFADENNATTESDIEETLKKLVFDLKKSPQEVFDALKNQTVDLVLTAHPTQSIRRSLLQKHGRFVTKYSIFQLQYSLLYFLFLSFCIVT